MNRRSFVLSLTAISALPRLRAALADELEAKWDEASQLYGNAWDVLEEAPDGEIAPVATGLFQVDHTSTTTTILALVHNNTDSAQTVISAEVDGDHGPIGLDSIPEALEPGGYGLVLVTVEGLDEAYTDVPEFELSFEEPSEEPSVIALKTESLSIDGDIIKAKVSNPSDTDLSSGQTFGMIQWFDEDANITSAALLIPEIALGPNEFAETEITIQGEFTPEDRYLIGIISSPN